MLIKMSEPSKMFEGNAGPSLSNAAIPPGFGEEHSFRNAIPSTSAGIGGLGPPALPPRPELSSSGYNSYGMNSGYGMGGYGSMGGYGGMGGYGSYGGYGGMGYNSMGYGMGMGGYGSYGGLNRFGGPMYGGDIESR